MSQVLNLAKGTYVSVVVFHIQASGHEVRWGWNLRANAAALSLQYCRPPALGRH